MKSRKIKSDRAGLIIDHSINFRFNGEIGEPDHAILIFILPLYTDRFLHLVSTFLYQAYRKNFKYWDMYV